MMKIKYIILFAIIFIIPTSCQKHKDTSLETEEVSIRFTVSNTPTKSITAAQENTISLVRALVFDENDNFLYKAYGEQINMTGFVVPLFSSTVQRTIHFIVNSTFDESQLFVGNSMANVLSSIEYSSPDSSIPMWGKIVFSQISPGGNSANISLLRSMARVDVYVNKDDPNPTNRGALPDFNFISAAIYRNVLNGRIVPATANLTAGNTAVTAATIPVSPSIKGITNNPYPSGEGFMFNPTAGGVTGQIYINENTGVAQTISTATCLIIHATYQSIDGYYRIDFATASGQTITFNDILRNNNYVFNIASVSGPGWPTVYGALDNKPSNITYGVISWDLSSNNLYDNIAFDGVHYFYAQTKTAYIAREAGSTITIPVNSDIDFSTWQMSFQTGVNGTATPIDNTATTISNDRFSITKSGNELTITAIKDFGNVAAGEQTNDVLIITAGRLKTYISLQQVDRSLSDWGDGGNQGVGL